MAGPVHGSPRRPAPSPRLIKTIGFSNPRSETLFRRSRSCFRLVHAQEAVSSERVIAVALGSCPPDGAQTELEVRVRQLGWPLARHPIETSATSYAVHFFFQAEDGIRDLTVTGVQTCALPI